MTGEHARYNRCPLCGGRLRVGQATVPFLFPNTVVVIKDIPAEVCSSCHEPFATGSVTDQLVDVLKPLRDLEAEILILPFSKVESAPTLVSAMTT